MMTDHSISDFRFKIADLTSDSKTTKQITILFNQGALKSSRVLHQCLTHFFERWILTLLP